MGSFDFKKREWLEGQFWSWCIKTIQPLNHLNYVDPFQLKQKG